MKSPLLALLTASATALFADPAGDAAAARLLEAMGGAEAWAAVDAVIVEATHWEMREPVRYANRIVNDFNAPRVRFEAHAGDWHRWELVDGDRATQRRDNEPIAAADAERAEGNRHWWRSNVYRTLQRLARRDDTLFCLAPTADLLEVHDETGRLNWFRLNPRGEPVQFGTGEVGTGTIFGPLAEHPAGVRYPAWGANADGTWRYTIQRFVVNPRLSDDDFDLPSPPAAPAPSQP